MHISFKSSVFSISLNNAEYVNDDLIVIHPAGTASVSYTGSNSAVISQFDANHVLIATKQIPSQTATGFSNTTGTDIYIAATASPVWNVTNVWDVVNLKSASNIPKDYMFYAIMCIILAVAGIGIYFLVR